MRAQVLMVCGLLSACSSRESAAIERVESEIAQRMLDPSSAQFKDVRLKRPGLVCGEVNGRNRFGGFTGFKVFVAKVKQDKVDFTIVEGRLPTMMTTDYPAEELAECFPALTPALRAILGDSFPAKSGE